MYYRKYFSGSVDATTTTNQYYMGLDKVATGTSRGSGHIKNRSDVIGNALVSTFRDIGYPNAYWDSTSGYFFFDKTNSLSGIYITVQSSYMYFVAGYTQTGSQYIQSQSNPSSSAIYGNSVTVGGYSPFEGGGSGATRYAFYVTIKGEPKGIFIVSIGTYTDHAAESGNIEYFLVCTGKDKRDNSSIIGFNFSRSTGNQFYLIKCSNAEIYMRGVDYSIAFATSNNTLAMKDEIVVLIPMFFSLGFLFLDNTYINPGITTTGFYEIDGDVYFVNAYYITKCITEV